MGIIFLHIKLIIILYNIYMSLSSIPLDILCVHIYTYLNLKDLMRQRIICKYICKTIDNYWKNFVSVFPGRYVEDCPDHILILLLFTCKISLTPNRIEFNNIKIE
jgi:hypothetical protein